MSVDPQAVVIRFRPTDPAAVLAWAAKEHRRTGFYQVSVFAAAPRCGEDASSVVARLLAASEVGGIDPARNKKFYVCGLAAELLGRGFTFHKDEDDDEMDEHFSVRLGDAPDVTAVEQFLELFNEEGHR